MINALNNNNNNAAVRIISPKNSPARNFKNVSSTIKRNGRNDNIYEPAAATAPAKRASTNSILSRLSDFDAARLMPHLDFVFLASGNEVYPADELSRDVYFPETSVISYVGDLAGGESVETAIIGSEGATGLNAILSLKPTMLRAVVTIEGTAWRIKTEALKQEMGRGGKLQTLLLEYVSRHINEITQRLICRAFHSIEKRFCSWLLMLRDRMKNNQLALTHENTALLFGCHRPTITLVAQMLRKRNLIEYSRGKIHILDCQGLENSACECYSILKCDDYQLEQFNCVI